MRWGWVGSTMRERDVSGKSGKQTGGGGDIIRAPAGLGTAFLLLIALIVGGGLYLIAVRGDALFLDLASLSGMLFCF